MKLQQVITYVKVHKIIKIIMVAIKYLELKILWQISDILGSR